MQETTSQSESDTNAAGCPYSSSTDTTASVRSSVRSVTDASVLVADVLDIVTSKI